MLVRKLEGAKESNVRLKLMPPDAPTTMVCGTPLPSLELADVLDTFNAVGASGENALNQRGPSGRPEKSCSTTALEVESLPPEPGFTLLFTNSGMIPMARSR